MWRSKKLVIVAVVVAAVVLAGSLGGVALAQTSSTDTTSPAKTLLARVATILGLDQQTVEDAFTQARRELRDEALDNYLSGLVAQGKISQEQADQYKTWRQSRPDMPAGFGFRGGHRGYGGMMNGNGGMMGGYGGMMNGNDGMMGGYGGVGGCYAWDGSSETTTAPSTSQTQY